MNQIEIIQKKRDGKELSAEELGYLISGYVDGSIPDYQIAAFLMAVYFQGMSGRETADLTRLMRDSGTVLDLSDIDGFKVDKHSTGGVGDKVSLVLAPLLASAGLIVPMISGRALAHTGGTLDKLEAIPGFRTNLDIGQIKAQLREIGVVMVGQTENLCPADKKIYALRDATATVHSLPLITASILSKKLAEGIDALVLDVKAGNGAIFEDKETAWQLAGKLVETASHFSLKTSAILTSMEQPLGNAVGNWLETREAIDTLRGEGPEDFTQLTLLLCAQLLLLSGEVESLTEAKTVLERKISSGEAFEKFLRLVKMHGGEVSVVEHPEGYPTSKYAFEIKSEKSGFVSQVHAREIGIISMALGAGRSAVTDPIDYTSGIMLHKKVGEAVERGELLATAYTNRKERFAENEARLRQAFRVSENRPEPEPLIYARIDSNGEARWNAATEQFESP